ncbi:MAG TPA: hypothetical protein VGQ81_02555 [Acidobacteriota bacterium]|jgi:hypothetical protein|nr:hypothetical protein [Acidobacteriota bacterium]
MNSAQPTYTTANCKPAYQLNWSVTLFWNQPVETEDWLDQLKAETEKDRVRILQHRFSTPSDSQFLASTKPDLAPPEMLRSIKGRLRYLTRNQFSKSFRGNYSVRSVGSQKRETIENYVASQRAFDRGAVHARLWRA